MLDHQLEKTMRADAVAQIRNFGFVELLLRLIGVAADCGNRQPMRCGKPPHQSLRSRGRDRLTAVKSLLIRNR
jgi:hypothetical protein